MIEQYLNNTKKGVNRYLTEYFSKNKKLFNTISPSWGKQLSQKLLNFSNQGKMIRGSLVILGYQSFGHKNYSINQIKIAAAMEIMHTSLLIHDDIMDRDIKRRGEMTIHEFYKKIGKKMKLINPKHFGLSTAICLGDIGFFLAADILHSLKLTEIIKNKIIGLFNQEIMKVGMAQQFEIFTTFSKTNINTKEILAIYKFKTARYTFSLPLKLGALSAGATPNKLKSIDQLGEKFGLIFQIQDDKIGIFGKTKNTGKITGSDVRENKKTLYYTNIFGHRKFKLQNELKKLYNKKNLTDIDIKKIQEYLMASGLYKKINLQKIKIYTEAKVMLDKLQTTNKTKKIYSELLEYNMTRQK